MSLFELAHLSPSCSYRIDHSTRWAQSRCILLAYVVLPMLSLLTQTRSLAADAWKIGVAKSDITPAEPVRLSGYASRSEPAQGVEDQLFTRALVMAPIRESAAEPLVAEPLVAEPLVIVSVDAIGISAVMTEEIIERVTPALMIPRSRIVFCTTHSHTAPHLDGVIPNLFAAPLDGAQRESTKKYTRQLVDSIVDTILRASSNLQLGTVEYGLGRAEFAINRRLLKNKEWVAIGTVDDGPVDRNVRVIKASDASGKPIAVAYQYGCHCTSISPDANKISADWAGISAAKIESELPGCIALPIIGCGADANPNPRGSIENAQAHGNELATSVLAVLSKPLKALPFPTQAAFTLVALASERPTKARLEEMQSSPSGHERNFANTWLELLKRKDRIPETYPAPVHYWAFGSELAWVFMGGEVVVDYQIRLERELSQFANVWVAGYVDDVFAYVASERVRGEGGYEVDGSMLYYGQPGRWESLTEEKIVDRVLQMTRQKQLADRPRSPEESLATIEVPKGWTIELVACEPLISDPVGVSFGADGKVWVVEMGDYPLGGGKTGCVKTLLDTDGDGRMDTSTMFLDGLHYPAGVYAWGDGVVIACAPEIFFARDTDGDGKCDERTTLLTGFPEGNPQHRVHGFTYGLDHRLYFGPGGGAEQITAVGKGVRSLSQSQDHRVAGFDISLDPNSGEMRLEPGVTQYIRATDDWGNWFGNENSLPMFHYVVDPAWVTRSGTSPRRRYQLITNPPSIPPVFPISQQEDRFNDLYAINRFTSACSTIINRGAGQGDEMRDYALVCEPVHNLVSRFRLKRNGATWSAIRTAEDAKSEFVRSSDPWFRPVRIENAPDGTLWILDMYRYVIEHPEWIPEEWQRRINVRAGEDRGRIYRVRRTDFTPRPMVDLTRASESKLLAELMGSNAARADLAQQILIDRASESKVSAATIEQIRDVALNFESYRTRVRALHVLFAMGKCTDKDYQRMLVASRNLTENQPFSGNGSNLGVDDQASWVEALVKQIDRTQQPSGMRSMLWNSIDPKLVAHSASLGLRLAIESSFAEAPDARAIASALAMHGSDPWVVDCAIFIAPNSVDGVIESLLESLNDGSIEYATGVNHLVEKLIPKSSEALRNRLLANVATETDRHPAWHYLLARQFSAGIDSKGLESDAVDRLINAGRKELVSSEASISTRFAAMELLLSQMGSIWNQHHELFLETLVAGNRNPLDAELTRGLLRTGGESSSRLLGKWSSLSQASRTVLLTELSRSAETMGRLLDAAEAGSIPGNDVDASTLQKLRQFATGAQEKQVLALFGPAPGADRSAIVRSALGQWPVRSKEVRGEETEGGWDLARGERTYQKHCAVCHETRIHADQADPSVGPNLLGLVHWTNEAWVTAILDPNRSVEEKYWVFQARTEEGELITGLKLREDSDAIEWVNNAGRIDRLLKSQIAELRESQSSLMPEGFEQLMSTEEIADIISYLRSRKE